MGTLGMLRSRGRLLCPRSPSDAVQRLPCRSGSELRGVGAGQAPALPGMPSREMTAASIRDALGSGRRAVAVEMTRTARRMPDLRMEKVVSHRYGFVWLANPRVASRSIMAALLKIDPTAVIVRHATIAELYQVAPATRDYLSFAFVRHPYQRVRSCHASKVLGVRSRMILQPYYGLRAGMTFDEFCAWLASPWGSDTFADRHWLSQTVLLREKPGAPLPDFIGRYEHLEADFLSLARLLSMPNPALPYRNRTAASMLSALSSRSRALLAERYAADFALAGYEP